VLGIFLFHLQARVLDGKPYRGRYHAADAVHAAQIAWVDIAMVIGILNLMPKF
jgi:hypothetical protein